jgi:hypothetical protein
MKGNIDYLCLASDVQPTRTLVRTVESSWST